jgi:hypothetical protein
MGATNIRSRLYYSGAWQHARSLERQEVKATWGVPDEGSDALTPAICTAELDNRTGAYAPDDTRSSLYGVIGRNTPGRVALLPGLTSGEMSDTADAFGRTSVDSWGSADSGEVWSLVGQGGTIGVADWQVAGGFGTHSVPIAAAHRRSQMQGIAVRDVDIAVTFKVAQATGARLEPANIIFRGTGVSSYLMGRVEVGLSNQVILTIYARDSTIIGQLNAVPGLTHTGTGQPLRVRLLAAGSRIHMKVWIAANAEPDAWQLVATDNTEPPVTGWIGVRSGREVGNSNASPVVFSYDNWESTTYVPIADGAVSSWLPDRDTEWDSEDPDRGDSWTDIAITGPSQRVNASKAVWSALRGAITAAAPGAYWPLEDGTTTTAPGSGLSAAPPLVASSTVTFEPPESLVIPGTAGGANLGAGGTLTGSTGFAPGTPSEYEMELTVAWETLPTIAGLHVGFLMFTRDATGQRYGIAIYDDSGTSGNRYFARVGPSGVSVETGLIVTAGTPYTLRLTVQNNPPFSDLTLYINDVPFFGSPVATPGVPITVHVNEAWSGFGAGGNPEHVSHVAVWSAVRADGEAATAARGYPGETTAARFLRICAEHGIPAAVYGSDALPMGPQFPDTVPNLLAEINRTEMGLMYDGRGWNGLELRTGASMRNQDAVMALTYGVDVAPPIRPATDDLGITNAVTANSRENTFAHAERATGPNNVSDPIDDPQGITRVETQVDVNPEDVDGLRDIAGWTLMKGTWPGARYRNVTIDLTKHPELIVAATKLRPGDRITIDELDADQVELLVLGGEHNLRSYHHVLSLSCAPAGPYRAGQADTAGFMRAGSSSSTLAASFNAGVATSMSVASTAPNELWSTTSEPYHIRVGGVVLNVTTVTGASSPQTFTVDAAPINGIERTIPAGSSVDVENPIFAAP